MEDFKTTEKINGKPNLFVVLEEGLLFMNVEGASALMETVSCSEPVKELVTV